MDVEAKEKQHEDKLPALQENSHETRQNGVATPTAEPQTFSSLLPKALSAVLQSGPTAHNSHKQRRNPADNSSSRLEDLQTELRELRSEFEQMKSQHNKEIKLLMNELDEEKRIRLTLQMEMQRMKKHISK